MDPDVEEILARFDSFAMDQAQMDKAHSLRLEFRRVAHAICDTQPKSRLRSLSLTHLEIAADMAIKGISRS